MQPYDLKRFLQEVPAALLRQYLTSLHIDERIDWSSADPQRVQAIFTTIEQVPERLNRQIHCTFRAIHQLADAEGAMAIRTELHRRHLGQQVISAFEHVPTATGQAFWTYLQYPEVFATVFRFRAADLIQRWHRVCTRPNAQFRPTKVATRRLEDDLHVYYQACQGRGHGCVVQMYPRDHRHYWFASLQDYAKAVSVYDECHQLHTEALEFAFEIVFVYDAPAGTIAIAAEGDLQHLRDLQRLFGRAVLLDELYEEQAGEIFYIQRFLDRRFPLPLLPGGLIETVHVQYLEVEFLGQRQRSVTVNTGSEHDPDGVYDVLEKALIGFQIPGDLLTVTQVGLHLTFRPVQGKRPKSRVIRITPRSCACTRSPWEEELRTLLHRWGLTDAAACDHTPARD